MKQQIRIFAALRDEVNDGWVWIGPTDCEFRDIIQITNPQNCKSIFCECRRFDTNFINFYNIKGDKRKRINENEPSIVISGWYRKKLGNIQTKSTYELEVKKAFWVIGSLLACRDNPQIIYRVSFYLGSISVVLGLLSVVLSIVGVALSGK